MRLYLPGDTITRKGEKGDWMGFIGKNGKAIVLDPTSTKRKIVKVLHEGNYVGEVALVYNIRRSADVEAFTWVRLHVLHAKDFKVCKEWYPKDGALIERDIKRMINSRKCERCVLLTLLPFFPALSPPRHAQIQTRYVITNQMKEAGIKARSTITTKAGGSSSDLDTSTSPGGDAKLGEMRKGTAAEPDSPQSPMPAFAPGVAQLIANQEQQRDKENIKAQLEKQIKDAVSEIEAPEDPAKIIQST